MFHETDKMLEDIIRYHKVDKNDEDDFVNVLLKIQEGRQLEVPITMDSVKAILIVSISKKLKPILILCI